MSTQLDQRKDITVVLILFTMLAMVGVLSGSFFVRDYARARASVSWPAVEGIVLSHVNEKNTVLRYVYSFDGRNYESRRRLVFSAQFFNSMEKRYAPGEPVMVYVNPDDHGYSIIELGSAGGAFVFFSLLSGACLFLGVGGVVWALSENAETYLVLPPNLFIQKAD